MDEWRHRQMVMYNDLMQYNKTTTKKNINSWRK